ncbi:MAG: hypothetical protein ACI4PQ_03945 [Butyricicoccaceae bacterium]
MPKMKTNHSLRTRIRAVILAAAIAAVCAVPAFAVGVTEGMVLDEETGTTGFIVVGTNRYPVVVTSSRAMNESGKASFTGAGDGEDSTVEGELFGWNEDGGVAMYRLDRMPAESDYLPLGDAGKVKKGDELAIFYFKENGTLGYQVVNYLGREDTGTFMTVSKPLDRDLSDMVGAPVVFDNEVVAMVMDTPEGNLLLPMNYISRYLDHQQEAEGSGSAPEGGTIELTEENYRGGISKGGVGALVIALGSGVAIMTIGALRTRRAQGETEDEAAE